MTSTVLELPVRGMLCRPCEDAVCDRLLATRGVIDARASYRKGRVTVEYDPALVGREALEAALADAGYPVGARSLSGAAIDALSLLGAVLLAWALPRLTALCPVPAAAAGVSLGYLFCIGLLTGTHCVGMCGGILLAQTTGAPTRGATVRASALYNAGRVAAYTLAGAVFGTAGGVLPYTDDVRSMVFTLTGALVLLTGLHISGLLPGFGGVGALLPGACALPGRTRRRFAGKPLAVGLLTGLMPCGALSSMWLFAVSTASAGRGACTMAAFALGTVPVLFLFGAAQSFFPRGWTKYAVKLSSVLVMALGLQMLFKGLQMVL